ncbi:MAG: hypothetical protein M5U09_20805 [Gammaproteobacteria bacterium]|nr:hypothetical protein [Gammaproteobacteria bacterium]
MLDVEQGEVPPVVEGEAVVRGPVLDPRLEQRLALVDPVLHLHHVGERMDGPAVAAFDFQCRARRGLGAAVLVALLEAEGLHAEDVGVAGHVAVEVTDDAADAVAQAYGIAEIEVGQVTALDGERVAGPRGKHAVPRRPRLVPAAFHEVARGGGQHPLAVVRLVRQGLGLLDALADRRQILALAHHQHGAGIEDVAEHETGVLLDGGGEGLGRVAEIALELVQRLLVRLQRAGLAGRDGHAAGVGAGGRIGGHGQLSIEIPDSSGPRTAARRGESVRGGRPPTVADVVKKTSRNRPTLPATRRGELVKWPTGGACRRRVPSNPRLPELSDDPRTPPPQHPHHADLPRPHAGPGEHAACRPRKRRACESGRRPRRPATCAGGHVVVLQHAAAGEPERMECDGNELGEEGRALAKRIGEEFRRLGIPVARVEASERCVARQTAELLGFGDVAVNPDLNPVGAETTDAGEVARLRALVTSGAPDDANVLLVSHGVNVNRLLKTSVEHAPGTVHVFRTAEGKTAYVGMVEAAALSGVE